MTVNWNPLVNSRFSLDGEFGLQEGYIRTLEFESGKKRVFLNNSFVPEVFPSVSLSLNNIIPTASGKTEYEEFKDWYYNKLRYGILPFQITRLGWKRKRYTRADELGIYNFLPESLKFDRLDGISIASFGLEEIGVIPEVEYVFLVTNKKEMIVTKDGEFIAV
jgi:hypothetical protein